MAEELWRKSPWRTYRRRGVTEMRPYVPGKDLAGISVSATDTPTEGGYVARNPQDPKDQWYVNEAYFREHMELVEDTP